jgi:hypothetical protein
MCVCTETDVRESANDCILASGEGHGSRGETIHPIYVASPVSSSVDHSVYVRVFRSPLLILLAQNSPFLSAIECGWYNATFTVFLSNGSVSHLPRNNNFTWA